VNTLFEYMYRDASNYKRFGFIVFGGKYTPVHVARLKVALDDGEHFIAHQLKIPEVFHWLDVYSKNEDDHCWHEYDGMSDTEDAQTDPRTIEEFIKDVEAAAAVGWLVWDPLNEKRPEP